MSLQIHFSIPGSSVIVWKQTDRIISAGDHLLRKDSRMSLIKGPKGIDLQIANVTPDDKGEFFLTNFTICSSYEKLP